MQDRDADGPVRINCFVDTRSVSMRTCIRLREGSVGARGVRLAMSVVTLTVRVEKRGIELHLEGR